MSKDILYPLRRLHGWLAEQNREQKRKRALVQYFKRPKGKKVLIPGTPVHTNLGDSAIVVAQIAFLEWCGFPKECIKEVSFSQYPQQRGIIRRSIGTQALIAQLGGGNMGSQWKREEDLHRSVVQDFPQNPMLIFPQTIYYAPDAQQEAEISKTVYNGRKELTIVAREKKSLGILQALYPDTKALLTPDIVLSATMETFGAQDQERNGVLLCMRSDAERAVTDEAWQAVEQAVTALGESCRHTDMHAAGAVTKDNRVECVRAKMEELASARLVITDRLHGMVFAAITGTPCIAFGNYNHKVRGTYEWIQYLPYVRYAESAEQAQEWIPELLKMGGQCYNNAPLLPYFEELARVVRKYAEN